MFSLDIKTRSHKLEKKSNKQTEINVYNMRGDNNCNKLLITCAVLIRLLN